MMIDLVITGCILPDKEVPYLAISDPNIRKNQYIETIKWSIGIEGIDNIIFIETSNFDYDSEEGIEFRRLKEESKKPIELLSFQADKLMINKRGKGYGEGLAIKYVINNSKVIDKNNHYLLKVTGRLTVGNINKIIKHIKNNKININMNYPNTDMFDTRLYFISWSQYIIYFEDLYKNVDDKNWVTLEHLFFDVIVANSLKTCCTYSFPEFIGKSGSTGKDYSSNNVITLILNIFCRLKLMNHKMPLRILRFIDRYLINRDK